MAINIDLYIDQGSDFSAVLPVVTTNTTDGIPLDLTPYSIQCQIRRSYSTSDAVQINTSGSSDGVITLSLPNIETAGLDPLRYVYDVVIINTNYNFILTGITGSFSLGEIVTGGTSGATGNVISWNTPTLIINNVVGTFVNELLTGGTSGAIATVQSFTSNTLRTKVFDGLMIVNPGVSDMPNTNLLTPYVPDDWGSI